MIVAFDASVLVYMVTPDANAPLDRTTGQPVVRCADRVSHLIATLQREKATIVIPTPSLAEVLVRAGDSAPQWLAMLERSRHFRIADSTSVQPSSTPHGRRSGDGAARGLRLQTAVSPNSTTRSSPLLRSRESASSILMTPTYVHWQGPNSR